jgi:ABC-type multidrug transport system permease subunit
MRRLRESGLFQLTLWRIREFLREPEALFWVFAFPILLAVALGLAFRGRGPEVVRVAVEDGPAAAAAVEALERTARIDAIVLDSQAAFQRLRTGRVALVVRPGAEPMLRYDSTRAEGQTARMVVGNALQVAAGREDVITIRDVTVREPGARYIDFLLPGLLGLNIMGTGMWGVGFGIVKNRTQHLLKRFLASPMRRSEYLLSFVFGRLWFLALEVGVLLLFGHLAFGVPVRGSLLALGAVAVVGALTFAGLGILVAARAKTIEGVSGLMNLVMVPMWIFSGVFFAYSNFPESIQVFAKALPLTALNDALRAVMLDGASLTGIGGLLGVLLLWSGLSFVVALRVFRWE